ncbi:MAG: dihydroorotase [Lachnospiraceae bacterium]|nr:dihydroorotase [Lachnospiraceae bacterium]
MNLLIKGGRVIDPATGTDVISDVWIEDGKIEKIAKTIKEKADKEINAKGCFVMPGFIDLHVHLRDPGFEDKETVVTGAEAAARGGFTTILAMPNTKPVVDNADVVNYVHQKAKNLAKVNVLQIGAITKGQKGKSLAEIHEMVQAGIPAISEDGKSVMNTATYLKAMKVAKEENIPVFAHCEDIDLVRGGVMNAGKRAEELKLKGITNEVEDIIEARDIMLANSVGCQLHLCHCSTKGSVQILDAAKKEGIQVTGEACPHHFTLSDEDIPSDDPNYKMNPPLRAPADVEAIREGLKNNIIDVIATDHAPHTAVEKGITMKNSPFGIVGLETAAALTYTELVLKEYLTPMQMAEKLSYNAAKIIGLDKGSLEVGKAADIVIFNPKKTFAIDPEEFVGKSKNMPYAGRKVTGRIAHTIVAGEIVYSDNSK